MAIISGGQTLSTTDLTALVAGGANIDWETSARTANFTAVAGKGYVVNCSGAARTVTLPAGAIVLDVILNITDASGQSETIDVGTAGTSNDPNGFFAAVPTNATIILSARDAVTKTTGSNETNISAVYGGALMYPGVINTVGTDVNTDTGSHSSRPWYVATADPVTYTLSGTVTSFVASITVIYLDVS